MKLTICILIALLLSFSQVSYAASEKSYQHAEELSVINNVKSQLDGMYEQMRQMLVSQIESAEISGSDEEHAKNIQRSTTDILFENLSWENIKDDYIELYVNTFTEEELEGIVSFSKSPLGKKLAEKTPVLMQKSMMIGQQKAQTLMPKVQAEIKKYVENNNL